MVFFSVRLESVLKCDYRQIFRNRTLPLIHRARFLVPTERKRNRKPGYLRRASSARRNQPKILRYRNNKGLSKEATKRHIVHEAFLCLVCLMSSHSKIEPYFFCYFRTVSFKNYSKINVYDTMYLKLAVNCKGCDLQI